MAVEDWLTLAIFWVMCGCVFLQFFTRYVLNDSFGWTEEIAIFCLVAVVFLGSVMCVRLIAAHPCRLSLSLSARRPGRVLSTFVDVVRIVLFSLSRRAGLALLRASFRTSA